MTSDEQPAVAGFEEAYRAHRLDLLRLAYLVSGSRELSEDVVQSAFASAHEHWTDIENLRAYLRRSVVNLVKDHQRRRFRWAARPLPAGTQVVLPPDVDETWQLVRRLAGHQRAVVVLHYYEDLPFVEIAEILGRPPATVRSDHRRALDRLRKALT